MQQNNIEKFYMELLSDTQFNENFKNKLNAIHDEKEYQTFIRDEILPIAKSKGYNLSADDIISYDKNTLQTLSEEDLASVAGGGNLKNIPSVLLTALTLVTSGNIASAKPPEQSGQKGHSSFSTYFKMNLKRAKKPSSSTREQPTTQSTQYIITTTSSDTESSKSKQPKTSDDVASETSTDQSDFVQKRLLEKSFGKKLKRTTTVSTVQKSTTDTNAKTSSDTDTPESKQHESSDDTAHKTPADKSGSTEQRSLETAFRRKSQPSPTAVQTPESKQHKSSDDTASKKALDQSSSASSSFSSTKSSSSEILDKIYENYTLSQIEHELISHRMQLSQNAKDKKLAKLFEQYETEFLTHDQLTGKIQFLSPEPDQWGPFQTTYAEITAALERSDINISKLQAYLKDPENNLEIFNMIRDLRNHSTLIPSSIYTEMIDKDLLESTRIHIQNKDDLFSDTIETKQLLTTLITRLKDRNESLAEILAKLTATKDLWITLSQNFSEDSYSTLFAKWNTAYNRAAFHKINHSHAKIESLLTNGGLDLLLMEKISDIRINLCSALHNGKSVIIYNEELLSQPINREEFLQALSEIITDSKNDLDTISLEDIKEEMIDSTLTRIQSIYTDLGVQLETATKRLKTMNNGLTLSGKTAVVGDIHGHHQGLQLIIAELQQQLDRRIIDNVVFLGDIIDRGPSSTLSLKYLLEFFNSNKNVYILRGNHETLYKNHGKLWPIDSAIMCEAGLHQNFSAFRDYIRELPTFAVVNNEVFLVHGGIPATEFDDKLFKEKDLTMQNKNMLWTDFDPKISDTAESPRGCGFRYGFNALQSFLTDLSSKISPFANITNIVRAHAHNEGPFHQEISHTPNGTITATTVITSPEFIDLFRKEAEKYPEKCKKHDIPLDRLRNHGSVVLLQEGKNPTEYFGITYNDTSTKSGLILKEKAFKGPDIETLDIMLPLNPKLIEVNAFAESKIMKIIVHDAGSKRLLEDNRATYGINKTTLIELRPMSFTPSTLS